ncbi:hypothetical protein [Thalassolituus marinus]|uniref:Uncharacterized protein n=1 Tax=Thalassolituus marinus TaxID=671053 RepID=A0ABS7ZTA3_9GAMM|nr:hypothetical protein [Thalassolituus marinus]MCA6064896.1 hypothetical protein [Thalassolituus marinus]
MSAIGLVIAIAIPVALVLFGLVIVGRRQQVKDEQKSQARLVRRSADDLLEALEFLIVVDNHKEIQLVVLERVEHLYALYKEALPKGDEKAEQALFDPAPYRQKIEAGRGNRRVMKSDRELRLARRHFGLVIKVLSGLAKKRVISETAMLEYRRYLRLTLMEKEVDTYTAQGDVAAGRGDVVTAGSYYKAAKKLLIEFDLQYPEKNEKIRALSKRSASLYNGGKEHEEASLAKALAKEEVKEESNEFGIPNNPNEKRRY